MVGGTRLRFLVTSLGDNIVVPTLLFEVIALHCLQIVGFPLFPYCVGGSLHRAVMLIELYPFRTNFLSRICKATVSEVLVVVSLVAIRFRFARRVGCLVTSFYLG